MANVINTAFSDAAVNSTVADSAPAAVLPATPTTEVGTDVSQNNFVDTAVGGVLADSAKNSTDYLTDNSLVEKRLEALLAKNNPLLKQATLQANQAEAANGRANTSMATQSGIQALLSKGLEIVTPDAATYAQADLANQQADLASKASAQSTTNQGLLNSQQAAYEYQNTNQQGQISAALNKQQAQVNLDQAAFEAALQSATTQQQAEISAAQAEYEMRFNEQLQKLNLNDEAKQSVSSLYATASASYITNVTEIMNNPDLTSTAKTSLINSLQSNFYSSMETMAALAGVKLSF